jgi:hypothetical protein
MSNVQQQEDIQRLIDRDVALYGQAFYTIDCTGNKTRIDPRMLVSVKIHRGKQQFISDAPKGSITKDDFFKLMGEGSHTNPVVHQIWDCLFLNGYFILQPANPETGPTAKCMYCKEAGTNEFSVLVRVYAPGEYWQHWDARKQKGCAANKENINPVGDKIPLE